MAGSRSPDARQAALKGVLIKKGHRNVLKVIKVPINPSTELTSYVVRAPTDEKFQEIRAILETTNGVRIKSEIPNRRALTVKSMTLEALPSVVNDEGVIVRPEQQHAPEAG